MIDKQTELAQQGSRRRQRYNSNRFTLTKETNKLTSKCITQNTKLKQLSKTKREGLFQLKPAFADNELLGQHRVHTDVFGTGSGSTNAV